MSNDGWKIIAEAMRRRQEEEAWALVGKKKHIPENNGQLDDKPELPVRTNMHRKRTRKS